MRTPVGLFTISPQGIQRAERDVTVSHLSKLHLQVGGHGMHLKRSIPVRKSDIPKWWNGIKYFEENPLHAVEPNWRNLLP